MLPKVSAFCTITLLLLLFFVLTSAGRPEPLYSDISSPVKTQNKDVWEEESSCEGAGEEECLLRRTLVAHTDYVYTQKSNP